MQTTWQQFLEQQGAVWESNGVAHFGHHAHELMLHDSDILVSLHGLGVIRATGVEARKFLLSQFTNDLNRVTPEQFQLNGYCSPKGRLLALMWVVQLGDDFLLILPRDILEATLKRLRLFVLNAKVTLEDASEAWYIIGCAGQHAPAAISSITGRLPDQVLGTITTDAFVVMRMPGTVVDRFMILSGLNSIQSAWWGLARTQRAVATSVWTAIDILSGLPQVEAATVDEFIPQMVNLEQAGGLSFTKGCYPGQEIVARAQYRGQVKRHLVLLQGRGEQCPHAGDKLYTGDNNTSAGRVVRAAPASPSEFFLLAVIENDKRSSPLHLENSPQSTLELMDLPYSVDTT